MKTITNEKKGLVYECKLYDKNQKYLETVYMSEEELKHYNNEKAEFCIKDPAPANFQYD